MMENNQFVRPERQVGVGSPLVIAELHFKNIGPHPFDNRSHLPADEVSVGTID